MRQNHYMLDCLKFLKEACVASAVDHKELWIVIAKHTDCEYFIASIIVAIIRSMNQLRIDTFGFGQYLATFFIICLQPIPKHIGYQSQKSYSTGINSGLFHKRQTSGHSHWWRDLGLTCWFDVGGTSSLSSFHFW